MDINLPTFAAAYGLFHVTHGIADYWFQTPWMAQNKSKSFVNLPLLTHCTVYALSFIPALLLLGLKITTLELWTVVIGYILIPHALMDNRIFLTWFNKTTKGWNAPIDREIAAEYDGYRNQYFAFWPESLGVDQAVKVHVTIHMDQKYHYLCLALVALWIACR